MTRQEKPPFSFPVKVGHVSVNPLTITLAADERERAALAAFWAVESVEALSAELAVTRWKRDGVRIAGRVHAALTQACVVTLEPVRTLIDEPIEVLFVPEGSRLARRETIENGELVLDPEGPDLPETFVGDTIDVGASVAEFAALGIDPYPRAPGAHLDLPEEPADEAEKEPSPFAVLKDWKRGEG